MYFDEDLVLDIRLNTLHKFVDKFVIAEATLDHAGNEKKLNFNINNFSKFKDKINYIVIEDLPINVENFKKDWKPDHLRDQFQRNSLMKGYSDSHDNDLIMISDIDEIPDPKKIVNFDKERIYACFIQKNYQSKLNLLNISEPMWSGTKICQKKNLKSPQWLRNIKTKKRPIWKFYKPKQPQLIFDGGWHFSFLKKPKDISKKIKSFAHQEFNHPSFFDEVEITNRQNSYKDLFDRNFKYKKVDLDKSYSPYILNNLEKFKDWII
jgi:beta-1,4-mannosyl-glycoprotein beta-1,4-N-acetylglucosaminyltransferase